MTLLVKALVLDGACMRRRCYAPLSTAWVAAPSSDAADIARSYVRRQVEGGMGSMTSSLRKTVRGHASRIKRNGRERGHMLLQCFLV